MNAVIAAIAASVKDMPGGLALNPRTDRHIDPRVHVLPLQPIYYLPLVSYQRDVLSARVSVGDHVKGGEILASGIVSPTSGQVRCIADHPWPHPSHTHVPTLSIESDGHDDFVPLPNLYSSKPEVYKHDVNEHGVKKRGVDEHGVEKHNEDEKLERIARCCVQGLGGAAFATATKIRRARAVGTPVLVVNAVECEPGVHCDDALMQNHADEIVQACDSLCNWLSLPTCLLAIENDKTQAIENLKAALERHNSGLQFVPLSAIYPSGAESTLVQRLTGIPLAAGQRAADVGVLCLNVATVLAIHRSIGGQFPVDRIVSITTRELDQCVNVRARFGTPITAVMEFARTLHPRIDQSLVSNSHTVTVGGPLSGFQQTIDNTPLLASSNALLVGPEPERKAASACIRCTDCATVCPVNLLPQELYSAAAAEDLDTTERYALDGCILCGCCDLVCPANIPLTPWFRHAKDALSQRRVEEQTAQLAKARSEKRTAREDQRAWEKAKADEQRRIAAAQRQQSAQDIKAALARVRKKRSSS